MKGLVPRKTDRSISLIEDSIGKRVRDRLGVTIAEAARRSPVLHRTEAPAAPAPRPAAAWTGPSEALVRARARLIADIEAAEQAGAGGEPADAPLRTLISEKLARISSLIDRELERERMLSDVRHEPVVERRPDDREWIDRLRQMKRARG